MFYYTVMRVTMLPKYLRLYNSISAAKKKKYHVHLIDAHGIR
ncbi:hypothetical protein HMPREF9200_1152 [Veillonella sp. oral taxon 780 str. F0422]|nr:hypothetical protein HMPREF9200_1152 [Veillonella sp. oral taxon 780 str. F0422]